MWLSYTRERDAKRLSDLIPSCESRELRKLFATQRSYVSGRSFLAKLV